MKKVLVQNWPAIVVAIILVAIAVMMVSCENFVEVDVPNSQLQSDEVFESASTANAAVANLYAQMRENGLLAGNHTGLTFLTGIYSDELVSFGGSSQDRFSFYTNNIPESSSTIQSLWNVAYNQIYAANLIAYMVMNSDGLTQSQKNQFRGEALFFRAVNHFYLAQLFGNVPFITGTNYEENNSVVRVPYSEVMELVINDLEEAESLLPEEYFTPDRARVNKYAALALLSRVYLYREQWAEAANAASAVINNTASFSISSLDTKFLRSSNETIWQLTSAYEGRNTAEGATFIIESAPPQTSAISTELLAAFEPGDNRKTQWLGSVTDGADTWYFPFKYKERNDTGASVEYSILLRLGEQYLIRAEARLRQGELTSGKEDLDLIRATAGLGSSLAATQSELLDAVLRERRVELFTEHGHRFFDLKRTGNLNEALGTKPGWSATDALWPLPQNDLLINPNLAPQNPGY